MMPGPTTARLPVINSYGWLWSLPADEALREIIALGHTEAELMVQPPHLGLDTTDPMVARLRAMVAEGRVTIHTLNLPSLDLNLTSPFAEMRQHSVGQYLQLIDLAAEIGVPAIILGPGRLSPLSPAPQGLLLDWLNQALDRLVPHATARGVRILIENLPFTCIPGLPDILSLIEARGNEPALGICYDAANAHFFGEDPAEALRHHGAAIDLFHISDTTRQSWRHDPLGEGDLDVPAIVAALDQIGWTGPLVLEIIGAEPRAAITRSLSVLRATGRSFQLNGDPQ